ncbi:MAG: hypothetical protein DMG89_19460 [Acidobacteria bacterium]|nr:MAG: hypothetical protein DMG89_19460 [Acidobacteriota bacterium]
MTRRTAILILVMLAVAIAMVATFLLLPKRYRISEHLAQTVVFWNPKEAFLFVTIQTSGRATNILQDKFAHTSYGYTAILLGGNVFFYKQDTIAYHLLPSGELDRFPLPESTTTGGSWTLRDGKLQLNSVENRFNHGSGFRWDGEKFIPVPAQMKSRPEAVTESSKATEDDLADEDYDDERPGFLSASDREKFKQAGWHHKLLTAYERSETVTLPMKIGQSAFVLTLRRFPLTRNWTGFDSLEIGAKSLELSQENGSKSMATLWSQDGWKEIPKAEYQRLAQQYGREFKQPFAPWVWLVLVVVLLVWRFGHWIHLLLNIATVKRRVVNNLPTTYSFPPVTPAQFPLLDSAALDRYTRDLEFMGFTRMLDFSLVADTPNHPPNLVRLMAHTKYHCFAEISQFFPKRSLAVPVKCAFQSVLQDGWTLSFTDRKPQAASSLLRRPKAISVSMPEAGLSELLQAFLKMREQVCLDLGISPLKDDTLEGYISKTQRSATEMREALQQKNFAMGLSQVYARKLSLLKTRPEYVWLGDYPKEAERRKQGYTMPVGVK